MKIQLNSRTTIGQVQDEFHSAFPYLQLAFYSKAHKAFELSPEEARITDRAQTVGHLRETPHDGPLYIEPDMMVWQLERLFETEFGLHVQVLRKSRGQWLQTSQTDNVTLEDQDARGRLYDVDEVEENTPLDYREQD